MIELARQALLEEAALILEQEAWLVAREATGRENSKSRIRRFAERYSLWQMKVSAFRAQNPDAWPEPPDNS